MPDVRLNPEATSRFQKRIDKYTKSEFKQEGTIHVTNLLWCLQKAVFRLKNPVDETPSRWMVHGTLTHKSVEPILAEEFSSQTEQAVTEKKTQWNGITGTIDLMGAVPLEFKTSEYGTVRPWYVEQLMSYCVMTGHKTGLLVTWAEGRKADDPHIEVAVYNVRFTERELEDWSQVMLDRKNLILGGVTSDEPLPESEINRKPFECRTCPYGSECPYYVYSYRTKAGIVLVAEPFKDPARKRKIGVFDSI